MALFLHLASFHKSTNVINEMKCVRAISMQKSITIELVFKKRIVTKIYNYIQKMFVIIMTYIWYLVLCSYLAIATKVKFSCMQKKLIWSNCTHYFALEKS